MTKSGFLLPPIPPEEMTPTVKLLLAFIEAQHNTITQLSERVNQLEAEVARLKKLPAKPTIRPSVLERDNDDEDPPPGRAGPGQQRPGSKKRKKRLLIHRSVIVTPSGIWGANRPDRSSGSTGRVNRITSRSARLATPTGRGSARDSFARGLNPAENCTGNCARPTAWAISRT